MVEFLGAILGTSVFFLFFVILLGSVIFSIVRVALFFIKKIKKDINL